MFIFTRKLQHIFPSEFQGAGAFEVAARQHLVNEVKKTVQGVRLSNTLLSPFKDI